MTERATRSVRASRTQQGGRVVPWRRLLPPATLIVALLLVFGQSMAATIGSTDAQVDSRAQRLLDQGRQVFRFDTFGDRQFWGGTLQLHEAIEGKKFGGVGPGISPETALSLGLKVDVAALPKSVRDGLAAGTVDLTDPATTLALLRLNAVLGVKGFFNSDGSLSSVGITCALCHSTVDDSFASGIGHRLDGWPNRDLNVGAIISAAPNLQAVADYLGTDLATVQEVLAAWGPGKFDAELFLDGKGFQPDGTSAATLLPPAYGLAGVNLHTYTGWGSVPYWNAFVANLEMHGKGTFYDPRLNDASQFPLAVQHHLFDVRTQPDMITSKLPALHYYQLSLLAPSPPTGSFDATAAARGKQLFDGTAQCSTCHVPPIFTEPGWNLHPGSDIGIDNFEADRSPTHMYRTTPLRGLWSHREGGFYHDGRFPTLLAVVNHYDTVFSLGLTDAQKHDLVEYLKSI
jgi:cytochrome c peroxidase